jgi:ribosomal protein L7/L12
MGSWIVVIAVAAAVAVFAALMGLQRRLQTLEHRFSALLRQLNLAPPLLYAPSEKVKQLAADPRRKIEAIRVFREETGISLKEAKTIIEELIEGRGISSP